MLEQAIQERELVPAPVDQGTRARRYDGAAVIAITVAAAALRFATLHVQSFDEDEAVTVSLLHHTFGGMLGKIPGSEQTPPVYYALAWVWARIFGFGEVGLRSLSVVAGTLLVPVMYLAGRQLHSRRAGVIAAALTAVNPLLFWYSQEARSYASLALFSGISFLYFTQTYTQSEPDRKSSRAVLWWGAFSALAMATHYFAVFLVIPEALLLFFRASGQWRRLTIRATLIPAAASVLLAPLAIYQRSPGKYSFVSLTPLSTRAVRLPRELLVGFTLPHGALWIAIVTALMLCGGVLLLSARAGDRTRRALTPCVVVAVAALALPVILAVLGLDLVVTRNFLAALVPCLMIAALAFSVRPTGIVLATLVCGIWAGSIVVVNSDVRWQRTPWRQAAAALGPASQPRLVVVVPLYRGAAPLSVYLPKLEGRTSVGPPVKEIAVLGFVSSYGSNPIRLSSAAPLPGFTPSTIRSSPAFSVAIFRARTPVRVAADQPILVRTVTSHGAQGPRLYGTILEQRAQTGGSR